MNKIPPQKLIDTLLEHYKAGSFNKVEILAKNLSEDFPEHPFGWKVLNILLKNKGNISDSLNAGQRALKLDPSDPETHYNVANTLKQLNEFDEAINYYQNAIKLNPNYIEAYNNLAITHKEKGNLEETINIYKKLITMSPNFAEAYNNLGIVLRETNRLKDAEKIYKKAIQINPNYAEAYNNLGITFRELGKLNESVDCYKKATQLKPNYAEAYNNLGVILRDLGKINESENNYLKAIKLEPNYAVGYYNLGVTLRELGKLYDSEVSYREAIKLKPKYSEAYNNLGIVLRELGKLDDSEATFKKAIALKPNYADAYHNLSFTLLQKSDFKQAFELYEWRWKTEGENEKKLASSKPIWKGENNSRIYIWKEQGIGDEIMFCSILPEMKDLTNKLIINCDKRLIPLFERSLPKNFIYETHREKIKDDEYDYHLPMGSLRMIFRNDLKSFANSSAGYLKGNLKQISEFKSKLKGTTNPRLIGLSWGSKSKNQMAFLKTIKLKELINKLNAPNIKFINLQYGNVSDEILGLKESFGIEVIDLKEVDKTNDIDALASLICACDLVISIDNFLVQLSGSLGVDTRLLLPFTTDPRWGLTNDKSYLYKSVSIYRQKKLGDWSAALDNLSKDLNGNN